jgi:hypothetical protein
MPGLDPGFWFTRRVTKEAFLSARLFTAAREYGNDSVIRRGTAIRVRWRGG